jgi:hypothetical protein
MAMPSSVSKASYLWFLFDLSVVHRSWNILLKSSIEAGEAYKDLYIMRYERAFSFGPRRLRSISTPRELITKPRKLTGSTSNSFAQVHIKLVLAESLQHHPDVHVVFFLGPRVDKDKN